MIHLIEQLLNGVQFGVMLFLMAAGLTLIFGRQLPVLAAGPARPGTAATAEAAGQSILIVDKNVAQLTAFADRHYILEKGRVAWSGSCAALAAEPALQLRFLGV